MMMNTKSKIKHNDVIDTKRNQDENGSFRWEGEIMHF